MFSHIIPNVENWPIATFAKGRNQFRKDLADYVFDRITAQSEDVASIISKSVYLEKQRIKNIPWKVDPADESMFWNSIASDLASATERTDKDEALASLLRRIINRYTEEIVGNFNKKTFYFSRWFLTLFFKIIFNRFREGKSKLFWGDKSDLVNKIKVSGYIEHTRKLFDKGTVVIVPTHFSNLDSIMIGYAIDTVMGMPAFSYGAGLNLYNSELPAYFMNRLGAYRVDRRKKNPIYLECLKSMAGYSLQKGINNIFFPGGTRSRSGSLEQKLKLGLLGSTLETQRILLENGHTEKIFVVPMIVSYNFVFEGRSLIEQYLKEIGKEKYVRFKDKKVVWFPTLRFMSKLFVKQSSVHISLGEPMDVLGNPVNEYGISFDKHGHKIHVRDYFSFDGKITPDYQRESVYTKILGDKIVGSYLKNNIVLVSHLVSYCAFRMLYQSSKAENFFNFISSDSQHISIDLNQYKNTLKQLVDFLLEMSKDNKCKLEDAFDKNIDELLSYGLVNLGVYHEEPVLFIEKDLLKTSSIRLLFYYHNRMEYYALDKYMGWKALNFEN